MVAVCDAGPLIHLDELASLDLLAEFTIWVPDAVWAEVIGIGPELFGIPLSRVTGARLLNRFHLGYLL